MTTPRDTRPSRRVRANGGGTVYQRKHRRWEATGYVLALGNTRKRVRVYGTTRKDALAKLTEKIATSNRGLPVPSAQGSVGAYLTYWLDAVAVHHLRENTHTDTPTASTGTSSPAWARRSSPSSLPRTFAPDSTSSAPPANAARAASMPGVMSPVAAPSERAAPSGSLR